MDISKLRGLDLFSGIGGLSLALEPWVETVAYCEQDAHAQGVLLSRMLDGELDAAPIFDDVTQLRGRELPTIDLIFGGFPCQDISAAGRGAGLAGERSGLFFEILRLAEETKSPFIFLENVPAIRTRGLDAVVKALAQHGYDCRWTTLSAQEVGAPHRRERWFLLATQPVADASGLTERKQNYETSTFSREESRQGISGRSKRSSTSVGSAYWETEPRVGRVANGVPFGPDRLTRLGNAVVPLQAQEAFKELLGLSRE